MGRAAAAHRVGSALGNAMCRGVASANEMGKALGSAMCGGNAAANGMGKALGSAMFWDANDGKKNAEHRARSEKQASAWDLRRHPGTSTLYFIWMIPTSWYSCPRWRGGRIGLRMRNRRKGPRDRHTGLG